MDSIISGAIQQQQSQIALETQMTVLKKSMDVQKELGMAMVGLIEGAAMQTPGKAIGMGSKFDAYA